MKSNFLNIVLAFGAVTMLSTSCGGGRQSKDSGEVVDTVLVRASVAQTQTVDDVISFTGIIEPYAKNNIAPALAVRIDRIYVEVGDRVSKGQLLAVMDRSQYTQTALQVANLETDYERTKAVYDVGGVSSQQIQQLETQLKVAKESAQTLKENIELRSPINGIVTGRYYDEGDLFTMSPNASGGIGLLQVMQVNPLKVKIEVPERHFTAVKKGMSVEIHVDLFPDQVFGGKVSLIYPAINAMNRSFTVEATIPNSSMTLRPGMFSRTEMKFGTKEGILIDDTAVQKQVGSNDYYVYVVENGVATRHNVVLGKQVGDKIDVISGINSGDKVMTTGATKVSDGSAVRIKE